MNLAGSSLRRLKPEMRNHIVALALLAGLTLAMFADVLFTPDPIILSQFGTDLSGADIPLKVFGFQQLQKGIMTLWNPHLWSGTAYLGGFDTGLLYPLNIFFLFLPPAKAINVEIALHTWLIGAGMFLLCRQHGLHPLAGFLAGSVTMFSGMYFLHIYSGHLNNLAAMAMAPYLYLAAALLANGRRRAGWMVGSAALALQLLCCQPQYVFYTCIGVLIYSLLSLGRVQNRLWFLSTLTLMVITAVALAAVQLLPARSYIAESLRSSGGMPYEFAAMFSFPPENLLTLLMPGFFGDMVSVEYWGRCYLWEMCLFFSLTAFVLVVYALCFGPPGVRRVTLPMIAIMFLLSLGAHTPLFRLLYEYVPGFNTLRGNSKFGFQMMLFLTLAAGTGLDVLVRNPRRLRLTAGILLVAAAGMFLSSAWVFESSALGNTTLWARFAQWIHQSAETYLPEELVHDPAFLLRTGRFATLSLGIAGGTLILAGGAFFALHRRPFFLALALCGLSLVEVFCFARHLRPSFSLRDYFAATGATKLKEFLAAHPGDYRILYLPDPNCVMMIGAQNLWGYGSTPLKRYVEFIGYTQGQDPDMANQYVQFRSLHRLYGMLRCRFAFVPATNGLRVLEAPDPQPRLNLVTDVRVMQGRDAIFGAMANPAFDPRRTVILETPPKPPPVASASPGEVKLADSGTDYLVIEAQLASPAVLLMTDVFSKGWKAVPLAGTVQRQYEVLPANYILRAIPLAAGHHRLRLEYQPTAFRIGLWISLVALVVYGGLAIWWFGTRAMPIYRRKKPGDASTVVSGVAK